MKTVVIFGGSGFVGQNIIRCLSKVGYRIVVPYQRPSNQAILRLFGSVGQAQQQQQKKKKKRFFFFFFVDKVPL